MTSTTIPHDFVSFFVCNIEKLIFWCIFTSKKYYNLMKNNHKFLANVTERCTSLSKSSGIFQQNALKVPMKMLNFLKKFTTHELLHKGLLRFPVRLFLTYLQKPACVIYGRHILYSHSYLKKVFLPASAVPEMESERKLNLSFWITFAT